MTQIDYSTETMTIPVARNLVVVTGFLETHEQVVVVVVERLLCMGRRWRGRMAMLSLAAVV